jgi:hypothetical protein
LANSSIASPDLFESVITSIRHQSESQPLPIAPDSPFPKSLHTILSQPSTSNSSDFLLPTKSASCPPPQSNYYLVEVQLNSGTTTSMGKQIHDAILGVLPNGSKLAFETEWLCKNAYRFVKNEFSQMVELELALLFELFFEAIGVQPSKFPFMKLVSMIF